MSGTTPNVTIGQCVGQVHWHRVGPNVCGCQPSVLARDPITKPNRMIHSHGPQMSQDGTLRTVDGRMQHHGPCHIDNSLRITFGNAILMSSTGAQMLNVLIRIEELIKKIPGGEDVIISVMTLDNHPMQNASCSNPSLEWRLSAADRVV